MRYGYSICCKLLVVGSRLLLVLQWRGLTSVACYYSATCLTVPTCDNYQSRLSSPAICLHWQHAPNVPILQP